MATRRRSKGTAKTTGKNTRSAAPRPTAASARALEEVERRLRAAARGIPRAQAAERARYMRPALPMLGLTIPAQRAVFRAGYGFTDAEPETQYPTWDHIWRHARIHETKLQPLFFLGTRPRIPAPAAFDAFWDLTRSWADGIDAWDQSDELSKTYSYLLESEPTRVYPQLVAWNRDANPWKRRQSIVGLFCYAQLHRKHPPVSKVLPLVRTLLDDPDYYVQKGVGWTLRETYNVYPERAHRFVVRHAVDLHPDAFSAALEKMSAAEKRAIKERRKTRPRAKTGRAGR